MTGGGWLVLLSLAGYLAFKTARAFVRAYDVLNTLPPHEEKENRVTNRYPLRVAGSIVGGLTAVINGLVGSGLFTTDQATATTGVVSAVLTLLATFGIVISTERKVTPLVDPRDQQGRPLTPDTPAESTRAW